MFEQFGDKLKQPEKRVVGTKQVLKLLDSGDAELVVIADDADEHIKTNVKSAAEESGTRVCTVPTKRELGEACGIKVNAACAATVK